VDDDLVDELVDQIVTEGEGGKGFFVLTRGRRRSASTARR
jgi:hypothetical protein